MPDETTEKEETQDEELVEETSARADETPLERAERERAEMLANWQRARADYQNLKRRTFDDIQAATLRERTAVLEEVLTVLDYLDMALASPCESDDAKNLQIGVQMTRDQLWAMLERFEITMVSTDGVFDTGRHQAVAIVESSDHAPGEIVAVVRRGFVMGEVVLRYAQVKVAAAPGTTESEIEKDPPSESDAETEDS